MSAALTALALCLGLLGGLGVFLLMMRRGVPSPEVERERPASRERPSIGLVLAATALTLGCGAFALLATGVVGLAIAAGLVGALALHWVAGRRRRRLSRRVEQAYPDLIEAVISGVRSGDRLLESLAVASGQGPSAIAGPAKRFWVSVQVSGDVSASLDELKNAWASPTGDLLIETVRVAYEVGGTRVVEVLRELADQIRRDRNTRREVEAKQSWVRVAARVGVAAPWVVLVLLSFRSEAAVAYNSPAGLALIITGLALSVAAYRLMLMLGRTPTPTRMFTS